MPLSFAVACVRRLMNRWRSRSAHYLPRIKDFGALPGSVGAVIWVAAGTSLAHADDRLAGSTLAQKGSGNTPACMICHGTKGEGQAAGGFPRLAGQSQDYLLKQLQAFARGKRQNPQMSPIASSLNTEQMHAVASYYASLPGWKPTGAPDTASAQYMQGLKLATKGNWTKEIPACFACHGSGGEGVLPHFPALAGQPMSYIQSQLNAWKTARRTDDPQGLMQAVAEKMNDTEIASVSRFLENPSSAGKGK